MPTKIKIKITKDILKESAYCGASPTYNGKSLSENCAVAVALTSVFGKVDVSPHWVRFMGKGMPHAHFDNGTKRYSAAQLPMEAKQFIIHFDAIPPASRMRMKELEFEIDVPDEVINAIGNIDEVRALLDASPALELV